MKKRTILLGLAAGVLPAMAQPKVGTVSVLPRVGVVLANLPGDNIYIAGGVGDNMTYSARYKAGLMAGVDIDWQFMPSLSATIGAQSTATTATRCRCRKACTKARATATGARSSITSTCL